MTAATTPRSGPGALPRVRRITFPFARTENPGKYFADDNIALSHLLALLSAGFPGGEEGFIRSVRKFTDEITDPVLKKRVAAFIGQEAVHGQQHRALNRRLVERGYRIDWFEREGSAERAIRVENRFTRHAHLAVTAAAEHYTAVLAERMLSSDEIQAIPAEPEVRNLLNWHAFEELEHKSVAFDVYRATGGSEFTRIATMATMMALTPPGILTALAVAFAQDPGARSRPLTAAWQTWGMLRGPVFRGIGSELAKYLRPGFHPDDIKTQALLERWQAELFGTEGTLVDHLK